MDFLYVILGGGLLYLGAEWLVAGAARLALAFHVPALVVGLTIVAYGTSTPEAVVSVQSALAGRGGMSLGNVVGSNIANIGLILGLAVLLRPAAVPGDLARRELPVLALSTLGLAWVLTDGGLGRAEGAVLLALALAYTLWTLAEARRAATLARAESQARVDAEAAESAGAPAGGGLARHGALALAGLALLLAGGKAFVGGASDLALRWGLSEELVGLTVVAVGTSLPELMTSCIAAWRGHADIAVGNVVGSNIFNVLYVLGLAGAVSPLSMDPGVLGPDLWVLAGFTFAALFCLRRARSMGRLEGGLLLLGYGGYLAWLLAA